MPNFDRCDPPTLMEDEPPPPLCSTHELTHPSQQVVVGS